MFAKWFNRLVNNMSRSTEETILEAAREVFIHKGFDGARMQDIADTAGINKALLHYYFRSKKLLFDKVFGELFFQFIGTLSEIFRRDIPFKNVVKIVVENYIELLKQHPLIPNFIIGEISRNPEEFYEMVKGRGFGYHVVFDKVQKATDNNEIPAIDARDFLANLLSMTVFPVLARPLFVNAMFDNNADEFDSWLDKRKQSIYDYLEAYLDRKTV